MRAPGRPLIGKIAQSGLLLKLNSHVGAASAFTMLTELCTAAIAFVAAVVTANLLGSSGRGELAATTTICGVAFLLTNLGIGTANIYFGARSTIAYPVLLGNSIVGGVGLGLGSAIITSLAVTAFPSLTGNVSPSFIYVGVVLFPLTFTELYLSYLLLGRKRFFACNLMNMLSRSSSLVLVIVGCLLWPSALFVYVVTQTFSLIRLGMNLAYMRKTGLLVRPELDWRSFRQTLAYAIKGRGNDIFAFLNLRFDLFVLNYLSSSAAVGVYSIGVVISEFSWYPAAALTKVIFPHLAEEDVPAQIAAERALNWSRVVLMCTIALGLAITAIGFEFVPLVFGSEFSGARWVIALLLPGAAFYSVTRMLSTSLSGFGYPQLSSVIAATAFVVTFGLDIILIPHFGINGAATASSVSYLFSALIAMVMFSRKTNTGLFDAVAIQRQDIALLGSFIRKAVRSGRTIARSVA